MDLPHLLAQGRDVAVGRGEFGAEVVARLGQRDFFLLSRENEWAGLDADIARIARDVIRLDTAPAIRQAMPNLPANALFCPDANPI
mgnify:CR=1 FL=1